jgi:hypothetical protein
MGNWYPHGMHTRLKPVFDSKPKNIEIRTKHERRCSSLSKNNRQPIRIRYLNFCPRSQCPPNLKFQMFSPRFHRLSRTLSQLGLPSSAHDFLIVQVTLLTYACQHSVYSTVCLVCLLCATLGNCLNRRMPLQQLRAC